MLNKLGEILTPYDKILIILIILVTLVGVGWSTFHFMDQSAKYIVIERNNKEVHKIRLVSGLEKKVTLELNPGKAVIVIKEGKVRILEMPKDICPLGICANTGWINKVGEMIVCMPNRIVISIKASGNVDTTEEPDAIVH